MKGYGFLRHAACLTLSINSPLIGDVESVAGTMKMILGGKVAKSDLEFAEPILDLPSVWVSLPDARATAEVRGVRNAGGSGLRGAL